MVVSVQTATAVNTRQDSTLQQDVQTAPQANMPQKTRLLDVSNVQQDSTATAETMVVVGVNVVIFKIKLVKVPAINVSLANIQICAQVNCACTVQKANIRTKRLNCCVVIVHGGGNRWLLAPAVAKTAKWEHTREEMTAAPPPVLIATLGSIKTRPPNRSVKNAL
tara:strand:- start:8570 stop:9064 length:495 start_codon:yes stop_codon:yes gene_type:complete